MCLRRDCPHTDARLWVPEVQSGHLGPYFSSSVTGELSLAILQKPTMMPQDLRAWVLLSEQRHSASESVREAALVSDTGPFGWREGDRRTLKEAHRNEVM